MFWLPFVSAKNSPRLMRPAASTVAASSPLARAIARPRSATSLKGVLDACAPAGGACMTLKSAVYSSISGSMAASRYAGGMPNLLGRPMRDGTASVRSL